MTIVCGLQLVETRTLTNLQVNNTSWPGSKFRLPLPRGVSCNSHFLLFKSRRLYEVTPEGKFFFTSLMTASSFSARKTTILRTMRQNKIRAGAALNLLNMPHNCWNCTRKLPTRRTKSVPGSLLVAVICHKVNTRQARVKLAMMLNYGFIRHIIPPLTSSKAPFPGHRPSCRFARCHHHSQPAQGWMNNCGILIRCSRIYIDCALVKIIRVREKLYF